jgi:hypothetical protein
MSKNKILKIESNSSINIGEITSLNFQVISPVSSVHVSEQSLFIFNASGSVPDSVKFHVNLGREIEKHKNYASSVKKNTSNSSF